MNNLLLSDLRVPRAHASFNGASGYHLEGDQARLSAEVFVASDANDAEWALQLWACKPHGAARIKVAELPIGLPAYETIVVDGWTHALPPAGDDAHTMALSLASGATGVFNEIHDVVCFPLPTQFIQPRFEGQLYARRDENGLELSVPSASNPRSEDNLSGTLVIELWDLSARYSGGAFEGALLASEEIGSLSGQASAPAQTLNVPLVSLSADAQLTLMLREWTTVGYVTRDFREVTLSSEPLAEASSAAENAAAVTPASAAVSKPAAAKVKATPTAPTKKRAKEVPAAKVTKAIATKATAGSKTEKAAASTDDARVSINDASINELAAIKGLNRNAAEGIIAERPYATLDEVVRAKGMGEKLLARLRDLLRV
ncbi:MAG TPA: helix-hairpin-helix domain-containing protein [Rhodocyclaceae bacterium]|nr:helix-hairpin-helix domain-containing protein [Rhodocyclaceae bacterium]